MSHSEITGFISLLLAFALICLLFGHPPVPVVFHPWDAA